MSSKSISSTDLDHVVAVARPAFQALQGARIFMTGGTGFFGHWLVESLIRANAKLNLDIRATVLTRSTDRFRLRSPQIANDPAVTLIEGDIRDFDFPAEPHSHILHAATDSVVPPGAPAYELPESILDGTRRVLHFARFTGARRLLYVSSGAVYGRGINTVTNIPETYTGAPDPLALSSGYDEAKRMAEHLCVAYSQVTQLECSITRCFAFVGPHLPLDAHFAIGNFIRDAIAGTPIHILGDGTPLRSYMYMSDLAAWLWTMLVRAPGNRAYNVGSDHAVSIGELAHEVANALRPGLEIRIDGQPAAGIAPTSYVPDITRARSELGLDITVDLSTAIRRTAEWHGFTPTL